MPEITVNLQINQTQKTGSVFADIDGEPTAILAYSNEEFILPATVAIQEFTPEGLYNVYLQLTLFDKAIEDAFAGEKIKVDLDLDVAFDTFGSDKFFEVKKGNAIAIRLDYINNPKRYLMAIRSEQVQLNWSEWKYFIFLAKHWLDLVRFQ